MALEGQAKGQIDEQIAERPAALPLTRAVAYYLFKLMAYKDEYEVARLYANGDFVKKIASMFDGDYRLRFHLAPPLLSRRDAHGHLVKQEFGQWIMIVFHGLSRLKFLRGTLFDPFSYTQERRTERSLIDDYCTMLDLLSPNLTSGNRDIAVALAKLPEEIRGYGHVKDARIEAVRSKQRELLHAFQDKTDLTSKRHEGTDFVASRLP